MAFSVNQVPIKDAKLALDQFKNFLQKEGCSLGLIIQSAFIRGKIVSGHRKKANFLAISAQPKFADKNQNNYIFDADISKEEGTEVVQKIENEYS